MGYLLFALLFFSLPAFTQKTSNTFLDNRCEFKTDGSGKSVGLIIVIKYPCSWSQADGDRPHVLKKFSYNLGSGKTLAQSLTILQLASEPSKREIAETFTLAGLKELVSTTGTFISGRKVKIDGIDCGETVVKVKRETPVSTINFYLLQYHLVYKDKMINLAFAASASNETDAKRVFTDNKVLFQDLATNMVLISKWEQ